MRRWGRHAPEPDSEPVSPPFRGFRIWGAESPRAFPDRRPLRSIVRTDYGWEPGVNTAVCHAVLPGLEQRPRDDHRAPADHCMCGLWALASPGYYRFSVPRFPVFGLVEGWGRMVIGPKGFRAEKARIVALCFPRDAMETLDARNGRRLADYPWVGVLPAGQPTYVRPIPPELEALIQRDYPVPVFEHAEAMQAAFSLTGTTAPVDDPDGPEAA